MSHPWAWTARRLAVAAAAGELSAADVVQAHLSRIAAVEADLRAFVDVDGDRAPAAARTQGEQLLGGVIGDRAGELPILAACGGLVPPPLAA